MNTGKFISNVLGGYLYYYTRQHSTGRWQRGNLLLHRRGHRAVVVYEWIDIDLGPTVDDVLASWLPDYTELLRPASAPAGELLRAHYDTPVNTELLLPAQKHSSLPQFLHAV